jgi:hypothetical protein
MTGRGRRNRAVPRRQLGENVASMMVDPHVRLR